MSEKPTVVKSVELPNGVVIPYVEQGNPLGIPVLLLHGYLDSWRSFELVLQHLPTSIHAFALTQRGHGDASRPAMGYSTPDFAADLSALIEALGLEPGVIVGGSSGGLVARRFALDYPRRTLGLVLAGSPSTLRDKPDMSAVWDAAISKLTDPVDPEFVRQFQQGMVAQPVPQAFLEAQVAESLKVPARVWKATMAGLMDDDSFGQIHRIEVPTLIVWGDQDAVLARSDQEALAAAIAGAQLVVYPGAGHALYWEEPERFAADLVAFVQDLAG